MRNIALCGKARSGKDTAAAHLASAHGYTRLAFADPLKEMALSVDPLVYTTSTWEPPVRLAKLVADVGWDYAKDHYPEVRRTLQRMGQTVRGIDPDFWVRALLERAATVSGPIVVTDMRYANEYRSLHRAGFLCLRIERPGSGLAGEAGAHSSETDLDRYRMTATVPNDGSLDMLHARIDGMLDVFSE